LFYCQVPKKVGRLRKNKSERGACPRFSPYLGEFQGLDSRTLNLYYYGTLS
jgi:hypothetical protein